MHLAASEAPLLIQFFSYYIRTVSIDTAALNHLIVCFEDATVR